MHTNLEALKIFHLLFMLVVEHDQLLHEFFVVAFELLSIFLEVQNGSRFALNFVNVIVVDSGNLVASLHSFDTLFLGYALHLELLLHSSNFWLDAELIVATFFLPKFFKSLSNSPGESVIAPRNEDSCLQEVLQNIFLEPEF